jgi:hypothetical protein
MITKEEKRLKKQQQWEEKKSINNSFFVAAGFIGLILLGGIVLFASGFFNNSSKDVAVVSQPPTAAQSSVANDNPAPAYLMDQPTDIIKSLGLESAPNDSVCGLKPGDTNYNVNFSDNVSYGKVAGVLVPFSSEIGGEKTDDAGLRSCYQFSTLGAVSAAMDLFAATQKATTREDLYKTAIVNLGADPVTSSGDADSEISYIGFKLEDTYPNAVSVTLLMNTTVNQSEHMMQMTVPVTWKDGDWKMVMNGGKLQIQPSEVTSTNSFTLINNGE